MDSRSPSTQSTYGTKRQKKIIVLSGAASTQLSHHEKEQATHLF